MTHIAGSDASEIVAGHRSAGLKTTRRRLGHTTDTQSAGPDFASRAEPKFWLSVLENYPQLRLNLAHFGSFTQAFSANSGGEPETHYDKTWEAQIAAFVKKGRFRNIYADISYFYWALDGQTETKSIGAAKKMFAKYIEADPSVEHLMFGTDWNMTGKAANFDGYVENVEAFFIDLGLNEVQLDNLFYKNASRFLGLDRDTKASARLKAFYTKAGKPYANFRNKRVNSS